LPAARAYREAIERIVASVDLARPEPETSTRGVLLFASDLGLCGGYNAQLTQSAIDYCRRWNVKRLYCVGQRPLNALTRSGLTISRQYGAPTSVAGLTEILLELAQDLLEDYLDETFATLDVISAKFEGVGQFTPVTTTILPVEGSPPQTVFEPSPYVRRGHLVAVALREYLYIRLYQSLLDSLASEHGARMIATQAAGDWLSTKLKSTHRKLNSIRREAATQEVLEIAASVRVSRRGGSSGSTEYST
jgi:F-type H+-transporting ATPase subunit gamma